MFSFYVINPFVLNFLTLCIELSYPFLSFVRNNQYRILNLKMFHEFYFISESDKIEKQICFKKMNCFIKDFIL